MGPKRGRVERGSLSCATPALNAPTFPNLKFISEENVERPEVEWVIGCGLTLRLRTVEFRQIPRAWTSFFVQTLEDASNQSRFFSKRCLSLLALLRSEPINVGRARVPTYVDDEMIGPKAHINVSEIRRIQHNHPVGKGQQDQEDNQARNKEEFYQPRVQQQAAQVQENQQALKFQRRMEAHVVRVTR
ncbi:hypothetical protein KIW84_034355 [Lathyrus oleraceus]|uniref:Uncharacterized protein n=1 Tax=Pisum sativum TaxID=3888 RepID=A0A9D4Y0H6_PEA|nr:hypothetical protein KIW84_034355 [Pisum sativum]